MTYTFKVEFKTAYGSKLSGSFNVIEQDSKEQAEAELRRVLTGIGHEILSVVLEKDERAEYGIPEGRI